jgi:hypothetical protein
MVAEGAVSVVASVFSKRKFTCSGTPEANFLSEPRDSHCLSERIPGIKLTVFSGTFTDKVFRANIFLKQDYDCLFSWTEPGPPG